MERCWGFPHVVSGKNITFHHVYARRTILEETVYRPPRLQNPGPYPDYADYYWDWDKSDDEEEETKPGRSMLEEDDGWDSDCEHEHNIQPPSMDRPISKRCKGYDMLINMGWKKDEGAWH